MVRNLDRERAHEGGRGRDVVIEDTNEGEKEEDGEFTEKEIMIGRSIACGRARV